MDGSGKEKYIDGKQVSDERIIWKGTVQMMKWDPSGSMDDGQQGEQQEIGRTFFEEGDANR